MKCRREKSKGIPNISPVAVLSNTLPQTPWAIENAVSIRNQLARGIAMMFQACIRPSRNGPLANRMMQIIQPAITAPMMPLANQM